MADTKTIDIGKNNFGNALAIVSPGITTVYTANRDAFIRRVSLVNSGIGNATINLYKHGVTMVQVHVIPKNRILEEGEMFIMNNESILLLKNQYLILENDKHIHLDINVEYI